MRDTAPPEQSQWDSLSHHRLARASLGGHHRLRKYILKLQQFANSPGSGYQKMSSLLFRTGLDEATPREPGLRLEIDTVSKVGVERGLRDPVLWPQN